MSTGTVGAVNDLTEIGSVLAFCAYAATDVGSSASAASGEEHERGALGPFGTVEPGFEAFEGGGMERGRVWDGVLLPGVGARFDGEHGEVETGRKVEEGGSP